MPLQSKASGPRRGALQLVCGVITGLVVAAALAVFITWVSLQPHKPKYYLDYGYVPHLSISDQSLVTSKLEFNLTTRNSNKKIGIYYDRISTAIAYDEDEFAWGGHLPFYQGHKNTTSLHTTLSGDSVYLQANSAKDMKMEKSAGKMDLEFRLDARIRFKVGSWKSGHHNLKVRCRHAALDVSDGLFNRMKCKVHV